MRAPGAYDDWKEAYVLDKQRFTERGDWRPTGAHNQLWHPEEEAKCKALKALDALDQCSDLTG